MFDVWMGDIELASFTLIFSIVVLLPIQLLLCFKVKSRTIRLLPAIILSILTAAFIILYFLYAGLEGIVFIFLTIFSGFMLLMCGIGWGIWAISKHRKRN